MPTDGSHRYLSEAEVAAALGLSVATIRRWTRAGRLRALRVLGRVVYDADEVARLLEPVPVGTGGGACG